MLFSSYILPVVIVGAAGLVCAVILAIAAKYMSVPEVEGFSEIRAELPGANCGACGFAGCDDYAKKLAEDPSTPTNLCSVGGKAAAEAISAILGVEAGDVEEKAAFVGCSGTNVCTSVVMEYEGIPTCEACKMFYQGKGACDFACLGYGDCVSVCKFGALKIVDGIAHVNRSLCTGCGACVNKCPNHLIELAPVASKVFVGCSNQDKGARTRKVCTAGCIGCKKCEKTCPNQAITVVDNLARIDHSKCTNCGACVEACPVHVLKLLA